MKTGTRILAMVMVNAMILATTVIPAAALGEDWEMHMTQRFPLVKRGATGGFTRLLQRFFYCYNLTREWIVNGGGIDGNFGPATENAVLDYQRYQFGANSNQVDGKVGTRTWTEVADDLTYVTEESCLKHNGPVIFVNIFETPIRYYTFNEIGTRYTLLSTPSIDK